MADASQFLREGGRSWMTRAEETALRAALTAALTAEQQAHERTRAERDNFRTEADARLDANQRLHARLDATEATLEARNREVGELNERHKKWKARAHDLREKSDRALEYATGYGLSCAAAAYDDCANSFEAALTTPPSTTGADDG